MLSARNSPFYIGNYLDVLGIGELLGPFFAPVQEGPNIIRIWDVPKPSDAEEPATFYGQDAAGQEVKGNLRLSDKNEWLRNLTV